MKKLLVALGILVGLLVLAGAAIVLLVDVNAHKPRIETAVSDAPGVGWRGPGGGVGRLPLLLDRQVNITEVAMDRAMITSDNSNGGNFYYDPWLGPVKPASKG